MPIRTNPLNVDHYTLSLGGLRQISVFSPAVNPSLAHGLREVYKWSSFAITVISLVFMAVFAFDYSNWFIFWLALGNLFVGPIIFRFIMAFLLEWLGYALFIGISDTSSMELKELALMIEEANLLREQELFGEPEYHQLHGFVWTTLNRKPGVMSERTRMAYIDTLDSIIVDLRDRRHLAFSTIDEETKSLGEIEKLATMFGIK